MLLPKDLLEDLEGGDRTEEIIKERGRHKGITPLRLTVPFAPGGSWAVNPAQLQQAQLQQAQQQQAQPAVFWGNSANWV